MHICGCMRPGHTANIKTCLLKTLRHSSETALDDSEQLQDEVVAVSFDTVFPEPVRNKLYLSLTQDMPLSLQC